jgi:hypothetical protein
MWKAPFLAIMLQALWMPSSVASVPLGRAIQPFPNRLDSHFFSAIRLQFPYGSHNFSKRSTASTLTPTASPSPPLPPTSEWRNSTNTGVPAGLTLTPSGSLEITQTGAVISGLDIKGEVVINASNVTLQNCKITNSGYWVVKIADGVTGAVVQNCEINGVGTGNDGSHGILGSGTFIGNNIYNVENGITLQGSAVIRDNYIHGLKASGAPHYDGIQIDGGISNVTISHNTVINDWGQTSAIMIDNYFGPISNISVDNNLLAGGGYTVYSSNQFTGGSVSGVSFTNNHMGRGHWGITNFIGTSPTYTGNINDGTALAAKLK